MYEVFPPLAFTHLAKEIGLLNPVIPEDGSVRYPTDRPGWGAEWDWDYFEKARIWNAMISSDREGAASARSAWDGAEKDRFGGSTFQKREATGFFGLEQLDGRWWFITPDGHPFLAFGALHCHLSTIMKPYNQEHWLEKLGCTGEVSEEPVETGPRALRATPVQRAGPELDGDRLVSGTEQRSLELHLHGEDGGGRLLPLAESGGFSRCLCSGIRELLRCLRPAGSVAASQGSPRHRICAGGLPCAHRAGGPAPRADDSPLRQSREPHLAASAAQPARQRTGQGGVCRSDGRGLWRLHRVIQPHL